MEGPSLSLEEETYRCGIWKLVANNITVGRVDCTPLNMDYISGMQVLCRTGSGMGEGAQRVEVNLVRDTGISTGRLDGFTAVVPTVSSACGARICPHSS